MMRPFSLAEAGAWLGVPVPDTSLTFSGVSTDTRTLQPGNLYVALRGERFDGHQFLMAALDAGAVAAIV
ncbi:MAG: Mur ligase domain-containing protein, partial [Marinobacter sp.]|nr:Mur ligase domain-containing protein [Marinobacter sp.]